MLHGLGFKYNYVVLLVWNIGVFSCPNKYAKDGSEKCIFNFFRNGSFCQECPAGYYGNNCSKLCIPPAYGCSCTQRCDCPICHYIEGCIFTPKSTMTDPEFTAGGNAEPQKTMKPRDSTNLIITLIGVVITFAILFSILHALRKHCSSEYVNGICNKNVEEDYQETESVYHEMDETRISKN